MSKGKNFQSLKKSRGKITYFSLSLAVSHIKRKDLAWDIDSSSLKEVRRLINLKIMHGRQDKNHQPVVTSLAPKIISSATRPPIQMSSSFIS